MVDLKTPTLLTDPFIDLVLRESPEHDTNGVAESAIREVMRQTRTLKFALEAHVGTIAGSHAHDCIRCGQFLQDWQRWLDSGYDGPGVLGIAFASAQTQERC